MKSKIINFKNEVINAFASHPRALAIVFGIGILAVTTALTIISSADTASAMRMYCWKETAGGPFICTA